MKVFAFTLCMSLLATIALAQANRETPKSHHLDTPSDSVITYFNKIGHSISMFTIDLVSSNSSEEGHSLKYRTLFKSFPNEPTIDVYYFDKQNICFAHMLVIKATEENDMVNRMLKSGEWYKVNDFLLFNKYSDLKCKIIIDSTYSIDQAKFLYNRKNTELTLTGN